MRVHDTRTGKFRDRKANDPPYAILSHTWDASEQSFQDVRQIQDSVNIRTLLRMVFPALLWFLSISLSFFLRFLADVVGTHGTHPLSDAAADETPHGRIFHLRIRIASELHARSQSLEEAACSVSPHLSVLNDLRLSEKIRKACAVARFDQFSQLWADTSCIDKTSSTELSEAINSMYAWYRDAMVCYVFLADVPLYEDHRRPGSAFRHSRWFTRGWTLQELIAPRVVVFLSREWDVIGTKEDLGDLIEEITGIDRDVLTHRKSLDDVSVAARMSWAARRSTTRVEDEAYCLLGIFGIIMTPIYGEGEHAFRRLQEEILRHTPDESVFAWETHEVVILPGESAPSSSHVLPPNQLMRFHDTRTGRFVERPDDGSGAPYAILSHTWGSEGEQSYGDVLEVQHSAVMPLRRVTLLWFSSVLLSFLRLLASALDGGHLTHLLLLRLHNPCHIRLALRLRQWADRLNHWMLGISAILSGTPGLSTKICKACAVARRDHHDLIWIDSSCIDKTSSTELAKAINSMYAWYRDAMVCYVFLADVPLYDDHRRPGSAFRHSRWFRRGWTLQELIAPRVVVFLSHEWKFIGTKESLADLIEEITGIDRDVLTHRKSLDDVSVAARMSWAARRSTTRVEDEAYCLLGLLGLIMTPLYYGEDKRAFKRLSEKILLRHPNETLPPRLPWRRGERIPKAQAVSRAVFETVARSSSGPFPRSPQWRPPKRDITLLAPSPRSFLFSGNIRPIHPRDFCHRLSRPDHPLDEANLPHKEYSPSPYGIRSRFHLIPLLDAHPVAVDIRWYLAILSCERSQADLQGPGDHLLARLFYTLPSESSKTIIRVAFSSNLPSLICLPVEDFTPETLPNPPESITVHIPHSTSSPRTIWKMLSGPDHEKQKIWIVIPRWTKATLQSRGYQIECDGSNAVQTSTVVLRLPRIPLIMCLRKGEQETSIFVPVRTEDRYWRLRWILDLHPDGDGDRTDWKASCCLVASGDPCFKALTARANPNLNPELQDSLLEELGRHARQHQWIVEADSEIVLPTLIPVAPDHYELCIEFQSYGGGNRVVAGGSGEQHPGVLSASEA